MALFNVSVVSTLNIPREVRDVLRAVVDAQARTADALDAIVAKLNEPDVPPEPPPGYVLESEVQARIDALVERLREQRIESADYVAKVYAEQFPSGPPSPPNP